MSDSSGRQYQKLPPGWDCKFDQATGNCYYINYFTKAIQLEDPRPPYRQLQNERCSSESIPMQGPGGSPYHVYPTNNIQAMRAFQTSTPNRHLPSSSRFALDTSPLPILKTNPTQTPRIMANMSRRSTIQETSFSNQIDTNAVVHKIQNMFPTASENHIRLLLKKYMKTIFPKADETLLLDILANADNNVQKASEKLISLGYTKRDFAPPPKVMNRYVDVEKQIGKQADELVKIIPLRPREYSESEKDKMKERLSKRYPQIAERILLMALESVNYAEDRAIQILQIVQEEEAERQFVKVKKESSILTLKKPTKEDDDIENQLTCKTDDKNSQLCNSDGSMNDLCIKFESLLERTTANGPNRSLPKGANENLLLADYVTWNGANPDFQHGQRNVANGSDFSLRTERNYKPCGHNSKLRKGAQRGLAKGSLYTAQNAASSKTIDIKCN